MTKLTLKREDTEKAQSDTVNLVSSRQLLGKNEALYIRHQGRLYILRVTKNGKLILN